MSRHIIQYFRAGAGFPPPVLKPYQSNIRTTRSQVRMHVHMHAHACARVLFYFLNSSTLSIHPYATTSPHAHITKSIWLGPTYPQKNPPEDRGYTRWSVSACGFADRSDCFTYLLTYHYLYLLGYLWPTICIYLTALSPLSGTY